MSFGIWNNLDELGLYLGLERLDYERDEDFFDRLQKIVKWKYKTDYNTLVHSIPIQLGLSTENLLTIETKSPNIPFKCSIDWEYFTLEDMDPSKAFEDREFHRIFINTEDSTLEKVFNALEFSETFKIDLKKLQFKTSNFKNIVRGTNYFITTENIQQTKSLANKNIVKGTEILEGSLLTERVDNLQELSYSHQYFLDYENGFIQTYSPLPRPIKISYYYYKPKFNIEHTDVNLMPVNVFAKYGLTDELIELAPYLLANQTWGK